MLKICIEVLQYYVLFSSEENFEVSQSFTVIACIRHCTETLIKCSKEYVFTYLLTPWSRVLLEKLTSKLCG